MDETFLTFQIFTDGITAEKFAARLEQCGIPYKLVYDSISEDPSNESKVSDVRIKIMQKDFGEAYKELADHYKGLPRATDTDYYLYDCNDEELMEIIAKPEEWDQYDLTMAQKILNERKRLSQPSGYIQKQEEYVEPINVEEKVIVTELKSEAPVIELKARSEKEIKQKPAKKKVITKPNIKWPTFKAIKLPDSTILLGYLAAIFLSPLGIYIGWSLAYSKKETTTGLGNFAYPQDIRNHGEKMLIIAITITIALVPILITRSL